jgi:hypothetical protein
MQWFQYMTVKHVAHGLQGFMKAKCCFFQSSQLCLSSSNHLLHVMQIDMKSAHIQTSSYEYDVLTDVISHLMISPMPQVPTMSRHRRHTPVDSDPALCALRAAMSPTLRAMWGQQRLLAAVNSCVLTLTTWFV